MDLNSQKESIIFHADLFLQARKTQRNRSWEMEKMAHSTWLGAHTRSKGRDFRFQVFFFFCLFCTKRLKIVLGINRLKYYVHLIMIRYLSAYMYLFTHTFSIHCFCIASRGNHCCETGQDKYPLPSPPPMDVCLSKLMRRQTLSQTGHDLTHSQILQEAVLGFSLGSVIGVAWFWVLRQVSFLTFPCYPFVLYVLFICF